MLDIALEFIRILIVIGILLFLYRADGAVVHGRRGWLFIKLGFLAILFGTVIDFTDNFPSLNQTILFGNTSVQAILEKLFGYVGGFSLLAAGLWMWLPSFNRQAPRKKMWEDEYEDEDNRVQQLSKDLKKQTIKCMTAERATELAEAKLNLLYDAAPIGITHGYTTGKQIEFNQEFATMLGYESAEELQQVAKKKGGYNFIWNDPANLLTVIARLKRESSLSGIETQFTRKDGSLLWVLLDVTSMSDRNGVLYYFYAFIMDINERKLAIQQVENSEQRLKKIMTAMPNGTFLVDIETQTIVEANPVGRDLLGYAQDELIGHNSCAKLCPRDTQTCVALNEERRLVNKEVTLRRKDGTELAALKTVARVELQGRHYQLETLVDISELKRLEQLKEDVDRIVQHDLKSPVIGVINATNVALMDESITDETREMLETIKIQGTRVLRMIGLSLTIYKIESGTYEYGPEPLDFMATARDAMKGVEMMAQDKGLTMLTILDGNTADDTATLPAMGNELLLHSILANLLINAVEASDFGHEVTLSVKSGPEIVATLSNSGAVPKSIRDTFFDKYATADKKGGTGLGTYSANLIAKTMGGSLHMETSDEENQTTITLRLPDGGD